MRTQTMGLARYAPMFLYAADKGAGAAVEDPPEEAPEETPPAAEVPPVEKPPEEAPKVDPKPEPPSPDAAYEVLAKEQGITVEEVKAKLTAKPVEPAPKPTGDDPPPEIPDYRSQAYEEAAKFTKFLEKDDDGDFVLSAAGVAWAENRSMQLAAESIQASQQEKQAIANLQSSKPEIEKHYIEVFKKLETPVPDEVIAEVAKDFTELATSYGLAAFDESTPERAKSAEKLRTNAYYVALGKQKEREIKAQMEAGKDGTPPEPARGGGGATGNLYEGLSEKDVTWLKTTWATTKNNGKPPTREQIAHLKETGVI